MLVSRDRFIEHIQYAVQLLSSGKDSEVEVYFVDTKEIGLRIKVIKSFDTTRDSFYTRLITSKPNNVIYRDILATDVIRLATIIYDRVYSLRNTLFPLLSIKLDSNNTFVGFNIEIVYSSESYIFIQPILDADTSLLPMYLMVNIGIGIDDIEYRPYLNNPQLYKNYVSLVGRNRGLLSEVCSALSTRETLLHSINSNSIYIQYLINIFDATKVKYHNTVYVVYIQYLQNDCPTLVAQDLLTHKLVDRNSPLYSSLLTKCII